MTLVAGNIRFMWIRSEGSLEMERRMTVGCRKRLFSVLLLAISSETSEIRPTLGLLYGNTESLISFPLISKYMTLNDPEWPFYVKVCFYPGHQYTWHQRLRLSKTKREN